MMVYTISISKHAEKQLAKFPYEDRKRILLSLERIRIRPYAHIKKLVGSHYFRYRVGEYRVILDIMDNRLLIHVIKVGHRKNIYKK